MSKRILIISCVPTHPSTAGNRARVATFSSGISSYGHDIYFLFLNDGSEDVAEMKSHWGSHFFQTHYQKPKRKSKRLISRVKKFFSPNSAYIYKVDEWYDSAIDKNVQSLIKSLRFDVVIVEYVFFSKVLNNFDDTVLKIIDTHSVFTDRHLLHLSQGVKPNWFSTTAKQEKEGLRRADVVIAIQNNDEEFFKSLVPDCKVITVGHITPLVALKSDCVNINNILIVASNNSSNLHATQCFMEDVYPEIVKSIPDVKVILAGDLCDHIDSYDGLIKKGRVDDLGNLYETTAVVVNPALFGTGLKIKTIEALGYSKPGGDDSNWCRRFRRWARYCVFGC